MMMNVDTTEIASKKHFIHLFGITKITAQDGENHTHLAIGMATLSASGIKNKGTKIFS